jgi:hypothetical protein
MAVTPTCETSPERDRSQTLWLVPSRVREDHAGTRSLMSSAAASMWMFSRLSRRQELLSRDPVSWTCPRHKDWSRRSWPLELVPVRSRCGRRRRGGWSLATRRRRQGAGSVTTRRPSRGCWWTYGDGRRDAETPTATAIEPRSRPRLSDRPDHDDVVRCGSWPELLAPIQRPETNAPSALIGNGVGSERGVVVPQPSRRDGLVLSARPRSRSVAAGIELLSGRAVLVDVHGCAPHPNRSDERARRGAQRWPTVRPPCSSFVICADRRERPGNDTGSTS